MVFQAIEAAQSRRQLTLAEGLTAIKLYSLRAATDVAMEAVQLFGGNGYMADIGVGQLARDAKSLMIYAGSNGSKVTHIAKGLHGRTGCAKRNRTAKIPCRKSQPRYSPGYCVSSPLVPGPGRQSAVAPSASRATEIMPANSHRAGTQPPSPG